MKEKKEEFILAAISAALLMSLIMMFSYIQIKTSNSDPSPFGMTRKHASFNKVSGEPVSFQELVDPRVDQGILLVSYDEGAAYIGVYDPALVNAYENTMHSFGTNRYFDQSDYISGSKSGILIREEVFLDTRETAGSREEVGEKVEEVLYRVDLQSSYNFNGQIREVVNLASLPQLGNRIYLDYTDHLARTTADRLSQRLRQAGYQLIEKKQIGLFQALLRSHETIFGAIMMSGLVFYILFGGICFWHFFDLQKEQRVHFLHGGTLPKMFGVIGKPFLKANALGLIPAFLFAFYQRQSGYLIMAPGTTAGLFSLHVLLTSLSYFMAFALSFHLVKKTKGVRDYAV